MKNNFIYTLLKTLNPKYYTDLADKGLRQSVIYFLTMLLFFFIITAILFVPSIYFIKSDLDKSSLDITELKMNTELTTSGPISVPQNSPFITIDTTGNKTMEKELLFITGEDINYKIIGKEGALPLKGFDFTNSREETLNLVSTVFLLLSPVLFILYYLLYLIKYILIIAPLSILTFLISKVFKNKVSIKQSIILALYTSTIMVMIEVLTLPFFISKYLISFSPFIGVNFSLIAITLYITLYITSVRVNGNINL